MNVEKIRKDVDAIDDKILDLLKKRIELAEHIGREKSAAEQPVFVPAREAELLNRLIAKRGKMPAESVREVFQEIIAASRAAEKPLAVAYLGPATTFTHMAALKKFGSNAKLVAKDSIREVFSSVEKHLADYGVVPIENSLEGTVSHTLDVFMDSDLSIVSEIVMDIRHLLLSNSKLQEIKTVYSHPQALGQCSRWTAKNLPNAELVAASSTAKAAELAGKEKGSAAIASGLAAEQFGLGVVAREIEDSSTNVTRFLVIGKGQAKKTGKDKTSIMFSVKHEAGTLYKALKPFEKHAINLTKIESRPARKKLWEVVFFLDFEGFSGDENVQKALHELEQQCLFVKVLGSYPKMVSVSG